MNEIDTQSRIYIITVIYNRSINEIRSLQEFENLLKQFEETRLIVVDNSTKEDVLEQNREIAAQKEWIRYLECGGNIGLSRAYNRALATIPQEEEEQFWIMLSDDDTKFSMDYLVNGCLQIRREQKRKRRIGKSGEKRDPISILCGVVRTASGWMSPRSEHTREFAFSSLLKEPKPGIYRDLYPINSGLFLEGGAIQKAGGFDENLFLDQIDYLMMDRLRAAGFDKVGVLPGGIWQFFSGEIGALSAEAAEKRWKIFQKDFNTYCDLAQKPWYYRRYILGRRRMMLRLQTCQNLCQRDQKASG